MTKLTLSRYDQVEPLRRWTEEELLRSSGLVLRDEDTTAPALEMKVEQLSESSLLQNHC